MQWSQWSECSCITGQKVKTRDCSKKDNDSSDDLCNGANQAEENCEKDDATCRKNNLSFCCN